MNDQIEKAVFGKNPPVKKSKGSGIRFVATYHLKVKDLSEFVKDLLLFLYSDKEFETVFPAPLIVSSRSARKIKDHIVRSKLYSVERSVGKKCRLSRIGVLGAKFAKMINSPVLPQKTPIRPIIVLIIIINDLSL